MFDWSDVSGARPTASGGQQLGFYLARSQPAARAVDLYTGDRPGAGTYYWRVQSTNQCGDGAWSSPVWSVIVVVPPGTLSQVSPENGGEICDLTPTFDWNDVTYASGYRLLVDDDPAFARRPLTLRRPNRPTRPRRT